MILVAGLIGVVVYVYFVSKDIITLDREICLLKSSLQELRQVAAIQCKGGLDTFPIEQNPHQQTQPSQPSQPNQPTVINNPLETVVEEEVASEDDEDVERDDDDNDENDDNDDGESQHGALLDEEDTTETAKLVDSVDTKDLNEMTIGELRSLCRERGISGKGTKAELVQRLKAS